MKNVPHGTFRIRPISEALCLGSAAPIMPWFIKHETFRAPHPAMRPHLEAHRAWVAELRDRGVRLSSGYLVDGAGQPGGGGLLLLEVDSYATAEALIRQDPMVRRGDVDWSLQEWIGVVGDLAVGLGREENA